MGIVDKLSGVLNTHGAFKVVSPTMLETIRKEIERHNERIRLNPIEQLSIRSLGADFILSGSVVQHEDQGQCMQQ